jgi:L-fuculose-phosphate aldolase
MNESSLRNEICRVGRLMWERGLAVATDGNLSARLPGAGERLLVTPAGQSKAFLEPGALLTVDLAGRVLDAPAGLRPTSELPMHLEVYRRRPDVAAVVHAHPPTVVALSIAGVSFAECLLPEVIVTLGLVPTAEYATPSSAENQRAIREWIGAHDAIVLRRHGSLTVGRDPFDAYLKLESLEHLARISLLARQAGGAPPLPPEQVEKLLAQRAALGLTRPGDEEAFCAACGVCHPPERHTRPAAGNGRGNAAAQDEATRSEQAFSEQARSEQAFVDEIARRVLRRLAGGHG